MSIFSYPEIDDSAILYKQFIKHITENSDSNTIEIPLANIFRLMEMYRYDSYYDGTFDDWHIPIVNGLDIARIKVFGMLEPKNTCIDTIEFLLQKISNKEYLDDSERLQLNNFLNTLKDAI